MTSLLSVKDLTVGFGPTPSLQPVVREVSFDLRSGETLAVVGESGSGKSVTALAINRLIDDGGGRIVTGAIGFRTASGRLLDLARATEDEMDQVRGREIGAIFQDPMTSLNPVMTIGAQVREAFALHDGLSRAAAHAAMLKALDRVRIDDAARRARQFPHELSGGMLQRVMIAMALAARPRLLIADEPTTALDVSVQAQIMALLAELKRETSIGLLFITHDIGLAAGIADKVMVMQGGSVVEQGAVNQLLDRPQHPYTVRLLRSAPHFSHGRLARTDGRRSRDGSEGPVLDVEGLSVLFPHRTGFFRRRTAALHAVEDITFNVWSGETLGIVGESGCGKSTTARALLGLVTREAGAIRLGDGGSGTRRGQPIQMVFQNPYASLNPRLTVEQLLSEPVIAATLPIDAATGNRMRKLIERVGLPQDSLQRYAHEFSGGQRQRLCIARALMVEPSILILDEAVSALDVSVQATVLDLLIDLQRQMRLAYVFISHDLAVIERIAHRVAVLQGGRIVEIGRTDAVLSSPRHDYTRRLIAAAPSISNRQAQFSLDVSPMSSLVRANGYQPAPAVWRTCGEDHLVRLEGDCEVQTPTPNPDRHEETYP
jgi:ABC-type glutathione transport system ATPase component